MTKITQAWQIDVLGAACCLAVTAIAIPVGLLPIKRNAAEAVSLRAGLEAERSALEAASGRRLSLEEQVEAARVELADCTVQLQPLEQLNSRMAFLTQLVDTSGLELRETELGTPMTGPRYRMVPIRVSGSGNYAACTAFLNELRQRAPDTGVAAFELSGNPERRDAPALFSFDLVWYAASSLAAAGE